MRNSNPKLSSLNPLNPETGVVCCQQRIDPLLSDALLAHSILPLERLSNAKHAAPAVAALSGKGPHSHKSMSLKYTSLLALNTPLLANNILPLERLSDAKHAAPAVAALSGSTPTPSDTQVYEP